MNKVSGFVVLSVMGLIVSASAEGIQGGTTFDSGRFGDEATVTQAASFDSGRFGDSVAVSQPATFDSGRFGDYTIAPTTGSVYSDPSVGAAQGNAATGYTQQDLDNLAADVNDVQQKKVDKASNNLCAMSKDEALAVSGSDSEIKEFLSNNVDMENPSQSCIEATKAVFKACSEGSKAAMNAAGEKALDACDVEPVDTKINPSEEEPQSAVTYTPDTAVETIADKLKNITQGNVSLPDMLTNKDMLGNLFKTYLSALVQQKVTEMLNGSSSSSSGTTSSGTTTSTDTTTTAVCDSVVDELNKADPVVVEEDGVTTTTNVTTNLCANGNLQQVKAVAVDNGTKVTTTTTTTVTVP